MAATTFPPGTRGDVFRRAIALTSPGPVVAGVQTAVPMASNTFALIQSGYTLIESQFKVLATDTTPLIDLSSARGELTWEATYPLPDGTIGPALVFHFSAAHTAHVIPACVFDVQLSGPGGGPETWISGKWAIKQDVTRTALDTPP